MDEPLLSFALAPRAAHFIGIAGAGMQSLAAVMLERGWLISGSDLNPRAAFALARMGARIHAGHAVEHVSAETRLVVHSDAIVAENVERRTAAARGILDCSYPELLAELGRGKLQVSGGTPLVHLRAVAGTHGKSTVTAMAAAALVRAGRDPTVICGAVPIGCATGGRHGRGTDVLVEACEYRANFLRLRPQAAVVLNVEPDHFDFYRSRRQLVEAFRQFVAQVPPDGLVIVNRDCPTARKLAQRLACRTESFGLSRRADWTAARLQTCRGRYRFWLVHRGRPLAEIALGVPGRHQVANALAAAALAADAGVEPEAIAAALSTFRGLRRRLEVLGTRRDVTFIDDYAHHPTEIRATLDAVRRMYPGRRVWCLFQPHQVSRTAALLDDLAESLSRADKVAVARIFRAREPGPRPGEVTAADLAAAVSARGTETLELHDPSAIARQVEVELSPGDVLITMGAGDLGKIRQIFDARLRKDRARG